MPLILPPLPLPPDGRRGVLANRMTDSAKAGWGCGGGLAGGRPGVFRATLCCYFAGVRGVCRPLSGSDPVTTFLPPLAPYPQTRLRRNRRDPWSRKLVAETVLTAGDLIWPVFVHDEGHKEPIPSMPELFRLPIPALVDAAGLAAELRIPVVAVFPAVPLA